MPKKPTPKKPEVAPNEVPPPEKPKQRAKGKVDPEILAIKAKHRKEIEAYMLHRNSGKRLANVLKMVPKLNRVDRFKLYQHLADEFMNSKEAVQAQLEAEAVEGQTLTEPAEKAAPAESSQIDWGNL